MDFGDDTIMQLAARMGDARDAVEQIRLHLNGTDDGTDAPSAADANDAIVELDEFLRWFDEIASKAWRIW